MIIQKAFNFRIYPTKEQIIAINKSIGCKRFVYNYFLGLANENKYSSYNKYSSELTNLKRDKTFLKEPDKFALQNSLRDLDDAFKRFFNKQNKYPKFKKKNKGVQSYRTNFTNNNIEILKTHIKLPKIGKVKTNKKVDVENIVKINSATIKKVVDKYYVSVQVEYNHTPKFKTSKKTIGVDLGISDYAITSDGTKYANPKSFKQYEKKLAKLQRKASRCVKDSNNQKKLYKQIAKLHHHIANSRRDFQHKLSKKLISENQTIVIESLKVKNMLKNRKLSKHIQDCAWSQFVELLEYKANWNDRVIIKVATNFPSSQRCSSCGYINKAVKDLSVREWSCPDCNSKHDRDINASKNLELYGLGLI